MQLSDLLPPAHVRVPLRATTKRALIHELVHMVAPAAEVEAPELLRAVHDREEKLSTGIGFGVAIPHGRLAQVPRLVCAAAVTELPVPFEALDGEPVRLAFLLVGPESAAGDHVRLLSRVARLVRRAEVRERLLGAPDPQRFCAWLREVEVEVLEAGERITGGGSR